MCQKSRRLSPFWTGINAAIADYVDICEVCRTYERRQLKETLLYHEITKLPWAKVGIDLMSFHERNYLIVVDYFSSFIEVDPLIDTTSKTVISKLKAQFARHGISQTVVTDNGPQFVASEFLQFAEKWEFDHITTIPYHSQNQRQSGKCSEICKHLMVEALEAREDPWIALLDQRNTPPQGTTPSPAQRLFSRRTNGLLPMKLDLLKPQVVDGISQQLAKQKETQAKYYNQGTRDLPLIVPGTVVRMEPLKGKKQSWKKAVVIEQTTERSYKARTEDGGIYRRNRRQLKITNEAILNKPTTLVNNDDAGLEQVAAESSVNLPPQDCQLQAESQVTLKSYTTIYQQEEEKQDLSEQTSSQPSRETEGST
ncbi:uncharacterized protein K02A2.6-like [Corticium candelabrum]|uniref:uncharacterized protein K02A2.6-like n=1 Tax=Corticium candelabrum TaxID=121492 RepID=UPI002E2548DE|nr:uncharacterized protein K02A2.6-like [Corticium candelabrum]